MSMAQNLYIPTAKFPRGPRGRHQLIDFGLLHDERERLTRGRHRVKRRFFHVEQF